MVAKLGHRLVEQLRSFKAAARVAVETPDDLGVASKWRVSGASWHAEVIVDPSRWLGMTFNAVDAATGRMVQYMIDTDLYDISRLDQRAFANGIESDIVEFLDNLIYGRMLRGEQTSDLVLVFPLNGSFVRLVAKRFATTVLRHEQEHAALAGGSYVPFN